MQEPTSANRCKKQESKNHTNEHTHFIKRKKKKILLFPSYQTTTTTTKKQHPQHKMIKNQNFQRGENDKLTGSDEIEVLPEAMLFNLLIIFILFYSNLHNPTQSTRQIPLKEYIFTPKNKREKHKKERKKNISLSGFSLFFLYLSFLQRTKNERERKKMKPNKRNNTNFMNSPSLSPSH